MTKPMASAAPTVGMNMKRMCCVVLWCGVLMVND